MKFLSVCSGIEAASVAWGPIGWKAVAFSEIEPFPCAVLARHYPTTPNLGDMTKFKDWTDYAIDLLCGGTPCQSFSVAGLRKGLDDPRGNLMLTFGAIAAKYRPKWLVWENVPGVLSSNGGADFGAFLGMLGQLGYGFAYRVLDAQYFGVAQRRRRVFVVGCFGDWRSAAAVLFERHSLQGHPAPRREAGKAAPTIPSRSTAGGGLGTDFDCDGGLVMPTMDQRAGRSGANSFATSGGLVPMVAPTLTAGPSSPASHGKKSGTDREVLIPVPHAAISPALKARDHKGVSSDGDGAILVPSMGAMNPTGVAYTTKLHNTQSNQAGEVYEEYSTSLDRSSPPPALLTAMQVRRLTPRECERLQGFPDDYTLIPGKRKNIRPEKLDHDYIKYLARGGVMTFEQCCTAAADGPRYKALGNSWAVPNVAWIGRRIQAVESLQLRAAA